MVLGVLPGPLLPELVMKSLVFCSHMVLAPAISFCYNSLRLWLGENACPTHSPLGGPYLQECSSPKCEEKLGSKCHLGGIAVWTAFYAISLSFSGVGTLRTHSGDSK